MLFAGTVLENNLFGLLNDNTYYASYVLTAYMHHEINMGVKYYKYIPDHYFIM